jgi:hypothetical protein
VFLCSIRYTLRINPAYLRNNAPINGYGLIISRYGIIHEVVRHVKCLEAVYEADLTISLTAVETVIEACWIAKNLLIHNF